MNLPADVAALLREALVEASRQPYAYGSYCLLVETIENLLPPDPPVSDTCDLCGNAENDCCCL